MVLIKIIYLVIIHMLIFFLIHSFKKVFVLIKVAHSGNIFYISKQYISIIYQNNIFLKLNTAYSIESENINNNNNKSN